MKGSFQSLAVGAACAVSWTCSVYDTDLLSRSGPTGGGPGTGGADASIEGGAPASPNAGTNPVVAGTTSGVEGGGSRNVEGTAGSAAIDAAGAPGSTGGGGGDGTMGPDGGLGGNGDASISCEAAPIPLKGSWRVRASHASVGAGESDNKPEYVMDLTSMKWSTGKAQSGDEWLEVDFGTAAMVRELSFTLNPDDANDYPRIYQIQLSDSPLDFNGPIRASGAGLLGQTLVVTFAEPVAGRYLLVRQRGQDVIAWWSISELAARCF